MSKTFLSAISYPHAPRHAKVCNILEEITRNQADSETKVKYKVLQKETAKSEHILDIFSSLDLRLN